MSLAQCCTTWAEEKAVPKDLLDTLAVEEPLLLEWVWSVWCTVTLRRYTALLCVVASCRFSVTRPTTHPTGPDRHAGSLRFLLLLVRRLLLLAWHLFLVASCYYNY